MPKLQVFLSDDNEVTHDLGEETLTIGRLPDNSIAIDDDSVSSHHAELVPEGNTYRLRDLDSTNGTAVNNVPATDVVLKNGDAVRIGRVEATFSGAEDQGEAAHPPPESSPTAATGASQSARPQGFVSSSPAPRGRKEKDPIGMAIYAMAALGIVTMGAGAYFIFSGLV